jgi:hypothetical protein
MSDLRKQLARIAKQNPALRKHLVPLLAKTAKSEMFDPSEKGHSFDPAAVGTVMSDFVKPHGIGGEVSQALVDGKPVSKKDIKQAITELSKQFNSMEQEDDGYDDLMSALDQLKGMARPGKTAKEFDKAEAALKRLHADVTDEITENLPDLDEDDEMEAIEKDVKGQKGDPAAILKRIQKLRKTLGLRTAKEFDKEDALKKYLDDHPGADKSNHSVKGDKDKGEKDEPGSKPIEVKNKKKDEGKATFKKNYRPKMESVMSKHKLTDTDAEEVIAFSVDRPKKGKPVPDAVLMQRFMAKAKPETRDRMKGMSPLEFMVMLRAVLDEGEGT